MSSGELREKFAFDKIDPVDNGFGVERGVYVEQFTCRIGLKAKYGGEEVTAQRLAGKQPFILKMRGFALAKTVTPEWRARDTRTGTVYNIRAVSPFDPKSRYIELLIDAGADADAGGVVKAGKLDFEDPAQSGFIPATNP
jgi:hypothetical protein